MFSFRDQSWVVLWIKYLINLSVQNIKMVNEEYTSMFNKYILLYNKKNRDCCFTCHLHFTMYNLFKFENTYTHRFPPALGGLPASWPGHRQHLTMSACVAQINTQARQQGDSPACKPQSSALATPAGRMLTKEISVCLKWVFNVPPHPNLITPKPSEEKVGVTAKRKDFYPLTKIIIFVFSCWGNGMLSLDGITNTLSFTISLKSQYWNQMKFAF